MAKTKREPAPGRVTETVRRGGVTVIDPRVEPEGKPAKAKGPRNKSEDDKRALVESAASDPKETQA